MNSLDVLRVTLAIAAARRRDKWPASRLKEWRNRQALKIAHWARERSPHYASTMRDWDGESLETVPVIGKGEYLARWNDITTDERLTKARVDAFLASSPGPEDLLLGRYHVQSTSGTSGVAAPFVHSADEWVHVCAGAGRISAWRGPAFRERPRRFAIISLDEGFHMGARIAASSKGFFESVLQVGAGSPTTAQVAALNDFQPDAISAYPSALASLAEEQAAGRLNISPKQIMCSSEMLTPTTSDRIAEVFGVRPHDTYSATEFAFGAASCERRDGMHLLEDMALLEVVDEDHRPVPAGAPGAKTLITVFWARTLPLIRYELGDRLVMEGEPCACGLPYARISSIEGRSADILSFQRAGGTGTALMSARQIAAMLSGEPVVKWQIARSQTKAVLRVQRRATANPDELAATLRNLIARHDVSDESLAVEICDEILPSRSGKTPLFSDAP